MTSTASPNSSDPETTYEHRVQLLLTGNSGTGKTSLVQRFVDNSFNTDFISTIGCDYRAKLEEDVCGHRTMLQLWDMAGRQTYMAPDLYRYAEGLVVVYGVGSEDSLTQVETWLQRARRYTSFSRPPPAMLVGNMADLDVGDRQVDKVKAAELAQRLGMLYFETSAKTGENVSQALRAIAEIVLSSRLEDIRLRKRQEEQRGRICCVL